MSEPEYKLIYFDTQGLAEPIRYIFALNGVKYVDERLPKDEHWPYLIPEVKASKIIQERAFACSIILLLTMNLLVISN